VTSIEIPILEENPTLEKIEKDVIRPKISTMKTFSEFLAYATENSNPIEVNEFPVKQKEFERFYEYYITTLRRSYEKLVEIYAYILKIAIVESGNKDFHKFVDAIPAKNIISKYLFPQKDENVFGQEEQKQSKHHRVEKPSMIFKDEKEKTASELYYPDNLEKSSTMI
jgi:hypothetical protein